MNNYYKYLTIASLTAFFNMPVLAGEVDTSNMTTFSPDTTARSAEVNANFNEHTTQINDNAADISSNSNAIGTNTSGITTNTSAIGSNTTNIGANTAAITAKQNRITGICSPGESIAEINADGTVTCEADSDTLGELSCAEGNRIERFGDTWRCSISALRSINYSVYTAQPSNGAGNSIIGITLPDAGTPGFFINFSVPIDAAPGANYVVSILFISLDPNPWSGTVQLLSDIGSVYKAGEPLVPGSSPSITTPLPVFTILPNTPTVQRVFFEFNLESLGPLIQGSSVVFTISRDTQDPTFDTHTGTINIKGIDIVYDAIY